MADNENARLVQNLKDAGCDEDTIQRFLEYRQVGRIREQKRLLSRQKTSLLEQVHNSQHKIDCLDFLLFGMEKNGGKNEAGG